MIRIVPKFLFLPSFPLVFGPSLPPPPFIMRSDRSRSGDYPRSAMSRNPPLHDRSASRVTRYVARPRQSLGDPDTLINLHRRVLLLISLDALRELATELESDTMDITTRAFEPDILPSEQLAIFTFTKLLTREQCRHTTISGLLHSIVEYIFTTWGITMATQDIALLWLYSNGEDFILSPQRTINNLLVEHRPFWLSGQGGGPQQVTPFRRLNGPYIMRLSCHKIAPSFVD